MESYGELVQRSQKVLFPGSLPLAFADNSELNRNAVTNYAICGNGNYVIIVPGV